MRIYTFGKRIKNDDFIDYCFSQGIKEVEYNHITGTISVDRSPVIDILAIGKMLLKKGSKSYSFESIF